MRTYDGLIYMSWDELNGLIAPPIDAIFSHTISAAAVRDDSQWGIALTGMQNGYYDVFCDWFHLHAVGQHYRPDMFWCDDPESSRVMPIGLSNHFLSSIWDEFEIRGSIATADGILFSPERFYA